MIPITVVSDATDNEMPWRLRDQLRDRGLPCVLLAETGAVADDASVLAACETLASAGISAVVHADPARAASLTEELGHTLPRVLPAARSAEGTLADCQAKGWVPAQGEVYTEEELAAVTARLQDLGYA